MRTVFCLQWIANWRHADYFALTCLVSGNVIIRKTGRMPNCQNTSREKYVVHFNALFAALWISAKPTVLLEPLSQGMCQTMSISRISIAEVSLAIAILILPIPPKCGFQKEILRDTRTKKIMRTSLSHTAAFYGAGLSRVRSWKKRASSASTVSVPSFQEPWRPHWKTGNEHEVPVEVLTRRK